MAVIHFKSRSGMIKFLLLLFVASVILAIFQAKDFGGALLGIIIYGFLLFIIAVFSSSR